MDPEQARLEEDLRGLVGGEVRCDDVFLQLFASDASIYQVKPLGVVRPRSVEDVSAVVRYAADKNIPLHARGAGTGLAGESLGPGLVIDFSRHFRRILRVDEATATVQCGVVHERLNRFLEPRGRVFGPDPAMSSVTTMGGVMGVDSSGSRWLRYGSARAHLIELQIVLADGAVMRVGREPLYKGVSRDTDVRKRDLINRLAELLARETDTIERHQPKSLVNRCGYMLRGVYTPDHLDLARLLCGSAGTLAQFTEITVATQPLPRHRAMALLLFESLDKAAHAVSEIVAFRPSACDLMDRRHIALARETSARYESLIAPNTEALILVEVDGDNALEVRERIRQVVDRVQRRKRLAFDARQSATESEMHLFWQLARKVVPTLYRLKGSTRPIPLVEDIAIPPASLPAFLVSMQNVLKRLQVTATLFAHAGHGQLHLRPFLDLTAPDHTRLMDQLASELYDEALAIGGTISGEHGDGFSRTPFITRQYGEAARLFREIKRIFDPHNIFNPGKVVGNDPTAHTRYLRPTALAVSEAAEPEAEPETNAPPRQVVELQLNWDHEQILQVARNCNGCGACRSQEPDVRMCPIFRFAPSEEASPRAKANLMRSILTGNLDAEALRSDDFKRVADLCVNCQMCRLECPAGVDIPKLMIEAKAAYVANDGLRLGDWTLTRLDLFSSLGGKFAPLFNWMLANRNARWCLEKLFGLAQGRKLPRFARRNFLSRAHRRRLTQTTRRSGRKVLYFVDSYANYHDPQIGEALIAVLEHNAVAVHVPAGQTQSGMAMVSIGAIDQARQVAAANVELLSEAVRQGYTIVCSEPSAALCLKREYPNLLDDEDTQLVAANTQEACAYLWGLHTSGQLALDFRPISAVLGYHLPCHMKALEAGSPGENLLRLIPGLKVERIEKGCSGMAGMFGLKRENYRNSLRAGWPLISTMRDADFLAGTTECSSCKIQMEQGTSKPTIHPLKLLALAYGLMPEVESLLARRGEDLIVT